MTTHAHDTEGSGSIADARQPAEQDYAGEQRTQYPAEPQGADVSAGLPTPAPQPPAPQPLTREELPPAAAADADASRREVDPAAAERHSTQAVQADPSTEDSLFAADDLTGLRSRWNDVQAGFVDDPRRCVETADGLVSDVVARLADSFSNARSRLEDQWSRGEDVSTEDLRLALKRYREFFERLLAV